MRSLQAVPATARALLPALAGALAGSGPAVLPGGGPAHERDGVPDDVVLVVPTSGSTGAPKQVLLTAGCLLASARATTERLGGQGQWLLAIPPTHIGGLQVLVRSLLAGTEPVVCEGPFTAGGFACAVSRLAAGPAFVSLVPTQLRRLLDGGAQDSLQRFAAVLLGGAEAPQDLLAQARGQGVRVVTTYGMSETAGGCVYDGLPLAGVGVRVLDGRIELSGDVVARGYRGGPDFGGVFCTSDLGRLRPDGRLEVLGRADDVLVTGGEKVPPAAVERALRTHPALADVGVCGAPDREWGQRVVAVVVLRPGAEVTLAQLREHAAQTIPRRWAPRELRVRESLPVLPTGKLDRAALGSQSPPPSPSGSRT